MKVYTAGCKDIGIRKSEFVAKTRFLCQIHSAKEKEASRVLELILWGFGIASRSFEGFYWFGVASKNLKLQFGGIPGFWNTRFLEFWSYSQGFEVRVLDVLPGFWICSQGFWSYSQGFGVTPRVLELLPGFWSYSLGFGATPRVLKLLPWF